MGKFISLSGILNSSGDTYHTIPFEPPFGVFDNTTGKTSSSPAAENGITCNFNASRIFVEFENGKLKSSNDKDRMGAKIIRFFRGVIDAVIRRVLFLNTALSAPVSSSLALSFKFITLRNSQSSRFFPNDFLFPIKLIFVNKISLILIILPT